MRLQLLPTSPRVGITPYFFLAYLGFFIVPYFSRASSADDIGLATASVGVFLVLYFRCYWVAGAALWRTCLMITALGVLLAARNPGACVFFIYSACAGAGFERPRDGVLLIGINLLLAALAAWLAQLAISFWLPALVLPVIVGAPVIYFAQMRRIGTRLLQKQQEVEHLSKIAERERIARDLHDVLGHSLSLIALKSELARRLIKTDPQRASDEMREVEQAARGALTQVRQAIAGYRSAGLSFELAEAKKNLACAGVVFETELEPLALPAALENMLSLVLREAVTNIVRHAGATHCHVTLRHDAQALFCEIADDGRCTAPPQPGNGLNGMRARIEALGGRLTIETQKPGLRLAIAVPLPSNQ